LLKIGNIEIQGFPLLLAPMEDVADIPFRTICKKFGADLVYSEFIASEALIRDVQKTFDKMSFDDSERPIGIQIFGNNADSMRVAAQIVESKKPDLIDINFGCPVRKIASKGCGAGLLNNIEKMVEITDAVVRSVKLPVTVKTRLGWDESHKNILEITERLQDAGIKAITIHGRTRAQMYKGEADWTLIGEVKNCPRINIPVIGNGDIDSPEKAITMQKKYNVDGIMIGRASYGNPWIFQQIKQLYNNSDQSYSLPTFAERVEVCHRHLQETIKLKGEKTGILLMRKHYGNYFKGTPEFKNFRLKLVTLNSFEEVYEVLNEILRIYDDNLRLLN
jgi:tRNA-dihydrouridine synthase B